MDSSILLIFVPACFALNMAPGPNNLLSLNNATRYGLKVACLAGVGRLVAFSGMISIVAAGLAIVLYASAWFFMAVKLIGAIYLFWLAVQLWRTKPEPHIDTGKQTSKLKKLLLQEFLVAAGNPKAILVFTAFLPQFIDPAKPLTTQFFILGGLFLAMEWIAIAIYAYAGIHLRRVFGTVRGLLLFNRGCATLLALAGAGLLASRRVSH
jgi:threonine/homoserine/homoserine lactone efflux protein